MIGSNWIEVSLSANERVAARHSFDAAIVGVARNTVLALAFIGFLLALGVQFMLLYRLLYLSHEAYAERILGAFWLGVVGLLFPVCGMLACCIYSRRAQTLDAMTTRYRVEEYALVAERGGTSFNAHWGDVVEVRKDAACRYIFIVLRWNQVEMIPIKVFCGVDTAELFCAKVRECMLAARQ